MPKKKPKCYKSYRYNVCLGQPTKVGTLKSKCMKCKRLEKEPDRPE